MDSNKKTIIYPYIPNSTPQMKADMLRSIGVENIEQLYQEIPDKLKFKTRLNLPAPFLAEMDLKKHIESILAKNKECSEYLNFLGAGCWQHYVPAVCDEITQRSEFLTAYVGDTYSDLGKFQVWFEFASQMGELVNMDVVAVPLYSWGVAAGMAIRMAARITGRNEVLLPQIICPERLSSIRTLCQPESMNSHIAVRKIGYDAQTGLINIDDLKTKISSQTAAVYVEIPSYLGLVERHGSDISRIAHDSGALFIVGVDPISLGVLAPPADYDADMVVGTAQTLGVHMNCGGGTIGFIASRDEERFVAEYPTFLVSITKTEVDGEYGFGQCSFERTSYIARDKGKDWIGTAAGLWTIAATVYMALMGPHGFKEIGNLIVQRSKYGMRLLSEIEGVKILFSSTSFKEFVVNFDNTGKTVEQVNKKLLEHKIFGGKDITKEFPELGNSALYCITEVHNQEDIKRLAKTMREVLAS